MEIWRSRLQTELLEQSPTNQDAIVAWLLGDPLERFDTLSWAQLAVVQKGIDYRYRILLQRYLHGTPQQAYHRLIQRLSAVLFIRNKIRSWIAQSRECSRSVLDVLQEVIQELIQSDRYLHQQINWIAQCTPNPGLRNALILAAVEEYCLRPIRNQPLVLYRVANHLGRSQRSGITHVPKGERLHLQSDEIIMDETDEPISNLDNVAILYFQNDQAWNEQQFLRTTVKESLIHYLEQHVDPLAARWLELYLQGHSQDYIAQRLNQPIKLIYRTRDKVCYHAMRNFFLKHQAKLVNTWLGTSLRGHRLGLTRHQWQQFWEQLTPTQQQLIDQLKQGNGFEAIAHDLNCKPSQVINEWTKLYLMAQTIRNNF